MKRRDRAFLFVVICGSVLLANCISATGKKVGAVIEPVVDTKNIVIFNSPKNPNIPLIGHHVIPVGFQESLGQDKVGESDNWPGKYRSRRNIGFVWTFKIRRFFGDKISLPRTSFYIKGGRFADVVESYSYKKWLTNFRKPTLWAWVWRRNRFNGEVHPSALILSHLTLDSGGLHLHFPQLLATVAASSNGITGGSFCFSTKYLGLIVHLLELTIKNNGRNNTDDHKQGGKNHHPSIRIVSPFGFFFLLVGFVINLCALWLIGIRAWDYRCRSAVTCCIAGGIFLTGVSVP